MEEEVLASPQMGLCLWIEEARMGLWKNKLKPKESDKRLKEREGDLGSAINKMSGL